MPSFTASQIERLGERLRREVTPEDLALLRELRESYRPRLDEVVSELESLLERLQIPGPRLGSRPAKTTRSIIAKLHRERTNLARMQDIAGCRVVVVLPDHQDQLVAALREAHGDWRVEDRRLRPSHGYRAVHLITSRPQPIEIQVRTFLQQLWAVISEALDRRFEGIKYGQGPEDVVTRLGTLGDRLAEFETSPELLELLSDSDALGARLAGILEGL